MPLLVLLLVVLFILAVAGLPVWPYAATWGVGFWPSGLLFLLFIVILIAALWGGGFTRPRDPLA